MGIHLLIISRKILSSGASANQPAYPVGDRSNAPQVISTQLSATYFFAFGFNNSGQTVLLRWNPSSRAWSTAGSYGTTVTSPTYSGLTWQAVYPSGDGDIYAYEAVTGEIWSFTINGNYVATRQAAGPAASIVSTGPPGYNGLPTAQISNFDGARCLDNSETLARNRPFSCSIFGYLLQDATLIAVDLRDGSVGSRVQIGDGTTFMNGIGYNVLDGYMYGFFRAGPPAYLARLVSDGTVTRVADGIGYIIGDIDNTGIMWAGTSREAPARPGYARYNFDAAVGTYTLAESGQMATIAHTGFTVCPWRFHDWAYVPGGEGYFFTIACDAPNNRCFLQRFSTSDKVCDLVTRLTPITRGGTFGACYATTAGMLYCQNNENGEIWRVDVLNPPYNATLESVGPTTHNNDGAWCVAAVELD